MPPALRTSAGASKHSARRPSSSAVACAVAVAITALPVVGCGGGGRHTSSSSDASAPPCLPTTLDHSATLAGTSLDVSPAPGTGTANPHTQISFQGVPATEIHGVSVVGRRSGPHSGHLLPYSQGDGGSFVVSTPFDPGEQVDVRAVVGTKQIDFGFRVDTPYSTAALPPFANPPAAPADYQSFDTRPGIRRRCSPSPQRIVIRRPATSS